MRDTVYKTVRTVQTWFPFVADAKASGQDLVRRRFRRPHEADFALFRRFEVDAPLIVDVGANRGQSITSFTVTCRHPRIVAFEPIPKLAARLRERDDPAVEAVHQCALGERPDDLVLYIPVYGGYVYDGLASLDEASAHWLDADRIYGFRPDKLVLEREDVQVRMLDEFELSPDIVKIDVQGTELAVILGGTATLERSEPVLLIEAPEDSLVELLDSRGYSPYAYRDGELARNELGDPNTFFITDRRRSQFGASA